jgi:hypothetical protein
VMRVGELDVDTWQLEGKCYGAMWPSRGLPRGTPPLVGCGKILWTPPEVELLACDPKRSFNDCG